MATTKRTCSLESVQAKARLAMVFGRQLGNKQAHVKHYSFNNNVYTITVDSTGSPFVRIQYSTEVVEYTVK